MKREVIDCDRCKKENIVPFILWLDTGMYSDPCEGSKVNSESFDLCNECTTWVFKRLIKVKDISFEDASKLAKEIRKIGK
jgi:hypothetical protein